MTGYYVVRRSMDLQEEFGPTKIEGISFISGISRIDEVGYSWMGIGNEGKGSWIQKLLTSIYVKYTLKGRIRQS